MMNHLSHDNIMTMMSIQPQGRDCQGSIWETQLEVIQQRLISWIQQLVWGIAFYNFWVVSFCSEAPHHEVVDDRVALALSSRSPLPSFRHSAGTKRMKLSIPMEGNMLDHPH